MERAAALGLDRLAGLLRQKRGGRGYREAVAEMASQGLGGVVASALSRAEHGRLVAEDDYHQLCQWVGMTLGRGTPDELRAEEQRADKLRA